MELTMRLLVCPVFLFTALLLLPTIQALRGIPSLSTSLRGFGNGRRSLSREEELRNALQFLEEYKTNLGDTRDEVEEDDWSPRQAFPYLDRDSDEDIVPDDFWEDDEQEDTILGANTEQFKIFLQNLLQGANRNDEISNGYYSPQRSSFNNQYVLFSPVDTDLEDEIELNVEIEKLKVKEKEEKLWEDILGDMFAEEILEADARDDIKELIEAEDEEAQLTEALEEDTIFEEQPWSEVESSDAEESDVVPWSWAEPEWENEGDSSLVAEFDTESLTSEEEAEVKHEAALLLLENMLAEEEEKQRVEDEQQEILEMAMGQDSSVEEDEEDTSVDEATEEAIEKYFRALLQNKPDEEMLYDDDENEIVLGDSSEADEVGEEESEGASSVLDIWDELSSAPEEDTGEVIQEYDASEAPETEENDIGYNILLREMTNEIRDEVEEEMVAALKDQLKETQMRYLNEDEEYEQEENNEASNEINELDAEKLLAEMFYQQEKRTECPIRSLVDDCAIIDDFPNVDSDERYRQQFQKACNRHQLCYTCGAMHRIESSLCDNVFNIEMENDCGGDDDCMDVADQVLFIAKNTHRRMSQSPEECQAKCLLPFLLDG